MYSVGKGSEIRVKSANHNTGVSYAMFMQANEVLPVESKQDALLGCGKGQDFLVRHGRSSTASLLNCQHIVTETAQCFNRWQGKILVGVEGGHDLS